MSNLARTSFGFGHFGGFTSNGGNAATCIPMFFGYPSAGHYCCGITTSWHVMLSDGSVRVIESDTMIEARAAVERDERYGSMPWRRVVGVTER